MKIKYFFAFILYSISSKEEELNAKNAQLNRKSSITKIILDDKLPKPTAWKVEEFSNSFQEKEENEYFYNRIEKYYYSDFFEEENPSDKKKKFKQINKNTYYKEEYLKKMNEFKEKASNDLNDLNIDIKKELDLNNITELMKEYKLKILNITSDDKEVFKNISHEYFNSINYFYFKIINSKMFLNKVENTGFDLKKIYYSSIPFTKKIKTFKEHPVLYGYYKAWVDHCPISVSPNIIWQLILNGLIKLINDNSEELRDKFVEFTNKKTLKLEKFKYSPEVEREDWEEFLDDISKQIKDNIKNNMYDNIILNFTTNTKDLLLVQQISSMSMFQKYFDYEFEIHTICGFPYIELEGEIEDWELILNKIRNFKNLTVDNWIKVIEKILKKIIDSKKGKIDIQFWKNLIIYKEVEKPRACFSLDYNHGAIFGLTGWITNFFPFNNFGHYLYEFETDSIYKDRAIFGNGEKNLLSEINETPMKLNLTLDSKENIYNLTIYSGILGVSQDPETFLVKPELGFLIAEKNNKFKGNIFELIENIKSQFKNSTNMNITDL